VTRNHVHLLVRDTGLNVIADSIQLIDRPIVERARRTIDTAKSLGMIQ
jgi:hypothetical protein